jgi:hypothetical protein
MFMFHLCLLIKESLQLLQASLQRLLLPLLPPTFSSRQTCALYNLASQARSTTGVAWGVFVTAEFFLLTPLTRETWCRVHKDTP